MKPFERELRQKIAERKMYAEEERERILEVLCREFNGKEHIRKRIEELIML